MRKLLTSLFLLAAFVGSAFAQPATTTVPGTLLTYPFTATGKIITLTPTAGTAGLNLPQGVAPSSPVNGDMWITSAGLFFRVAGVTAGPIGSSGLITNGTPITGGSAGNVLYTDGSKLQAYAAVPISIIGSTSAAPVIGGNSVLGNWTNGGGAISVLTMPTCADTSGQHLNYVGNVGITCGSSSGPGTGLPVFNVLNFANVAVAFNTAATAGGGIVFFPENAGTPYVVSAQTVSTGITVQCANKNSVNIKAGSTTTNIFNVSGAHVAIQNCGFLANGTPGTSQTAGAFINVTADDFSMFGNLFNGPYIGVLLNTGSAVAHIVDTVVYSMTQRTTSAGGSAVKCIDGGDVHISQLTIEANGAGQSNWPSYGVEIPGGTSIGCALTINDSALLNVNVGLMLDPGASATAYAKASNVWFDNDGAYSVFVCPTSTGVVGQVNITNSEIGPMATGSSGIALDTYSGDSCGGTISQATITGNTMFNYTNGQGGGVQVRGANTFNVTITGNVIGQGPSFQFLSAIEIDDGAGNVTAGFNSLGGSTDAIYCSSTGGNILITNNTLNGGGVANACSGAKVTISGNQ